MVKNIFFSAGDASADLHVSGVISSLKRLDGDVRITSVGGKRIGKASDTFLYDIAALDVHGYFEPVRQYFRLRDIFYSRVIPAIRDKKPAAVVLSDYYGFNIHIAEYAKSLGIPVYYFISPQVWATRYNRIKRLKRSVSRMLVIFPFEEEIYRNAGIPVTFVGHPLLDLLPENAARKENKGTEFRIGIFPGSRKNVIEWNLPAMEKAAGIISRENPGVRFIVAGLRELSGCYGTRLEVAYDMDYSARRGLDMAIAVSGTNNLENALLGIPMVSVYKMPYPMYLLIRSMIRVSSVSIVNLIFKKNIIPELLQNEASPENIAAAVTGWLKHPEKPAGIRAEFEKLPGMLGSRGAVERAARIILEGLQ